MTRTTISLPDDLAELLLREARRRRVSVSQVVRSLVAEALVGTPEKPRQIPWAGLFSDPRMVAGEDVERALEGDWADDIHRDRG